MRRRAKKRKRQQAVLSFTDVGEEDEDSAALAASGDTSAAAAAAAPLRRDHPAVSEITPPPWLRGVPLEAITVFVDPLDGTREFVEGRVRNVETLIGIAVRGQAQAGVIGLPMWRRSRCRAPAPINSSPRCDD